MLRFLRVLLLIGILCSCHRNDKLRPADRLKGEAKILRKKQRAYKKERRKKLKNKRKTGYYGFFCKALINSQVS
mgnify:CR=1 FL=1